MTERERLLAVYYGKKPDRVPYILDLGHYFFWRFQKPWDLCNGYDEPDREKIDFTRSMGAGFYVADQARMSGGHYTNGVKATAVTSTVSGVPEICWRFDTPIGSIERIRVWEPGSYSWAIKKWGVETEKDLEILGYAMSSFEFEPMPEKYKAWVDYVGEDGLLGVGPGYSAMGHLLNYWMGVENTIYATYDWEDLMDEVVTKINDNILKTTKLWCSEYGAEILGTGDNFSSDVQSPAFFKRWSQDFYKKAFRIAHDHGMKTSVHVDGKLKGLMKLMYETGADRIDAVTPGSVGGMTAAEVRAEAPDELILSGGIPNELWYAYSPMEKFEQAAKDWLDLKKISPALMMAAGDQVPPGAEERKIRRLTELVDEYGWY